ncbi:hypothetical protein GHT06_008892 [Daphnia sinensis]|uniref:Peptidase aspartic putative domain-containing protein n=1 Tax=Daphnia sinensis TaxID=1820382 RepID=A0AAD5Q112_9CRUS|nr:hypothetical protein GHT06_008892 [Daphnia sinensis]
MPILNDIPTSNLVDCKARQKVVRRKITDLHTRINAIVSELEAIHDRIIELLDEDDVAAVNIQTTQHLTYASFVDSASSLVENYLTLRIGDPASVIVETPEESARRQALQTAEQLLRDARAELEEAEQDFVDLGEKPNVREKGDKPSVTIQLEVYSGRALDWFAWISMWYALVHITSKTPSKKLAILKNFLKGDLADIVHGHGGGESGYKEALQLLRSTCGNQTVIRAAHLQALDRTEVPKNDPQFFKRFTKRTGHADIIERLALKLQLTDRLAWNDGRGVDLEHRTINEFCRWLTARAIAYQNAYAIAEKQQRPEPSNTKTNHQTPHQAQPRPSQQHKRNVRTHHGSSRTHDQKEHGSTEQKEKKHGELYCFKCEGLHHLENCTFFRDLPVSDRLTFVQHRGICYGCFGLGDGCKLTHHRLLHKDRTSVERTAKSHTLRADRRQIAFKMLREDALDANGDFVPVNELMDDGSDSTLIQEGLARGVGEESSTHLASEYLELRLKTSSEEILSIQGSTIPSITKPVAVVFWERLRGRWTHLADLPPLRTCGGRVDVLIGLDHVALITATESRFGKDDEPTASKTRLGWTLQGAVETSDGSSIARVHHVRRFCDTESSSTKFKAECMSVANQRAVTRLGAEMEKLSIGYAAPVLWIDDVPPEIPDSRHTAETRCKSLLNKFAWGPADYEVYYRAAIAKNFTEGYAQRLSAKEITQRPTTYFLPHFGIPKMAGRPELRVVFDAAAKSHGKCLNDFITSGPALQNPLPSAFERERWPGRPEPFSRIRLKEMDRPYHRFIWPEKDRTVSTCEMTRVLPLCSHSHYEAAEVVRRNLYVDDYLDFARDLADAVRRAKAVRNVLADGYFCLGHWPSNVSKLLDMVQSRAATSDGGENVAHHIGADDPEMVLGIIWNPYSDMLGFRVKIANITYTILGLLSKVAGLFDPLGTAAPMTVKAKIKLRELGVKGLSWKDSVSGEDRIWWFQYFEEIEKLKGVEFLRCLFPEEHDIMRVELHTFTNASEEACAASCYTRIIYTDNPVLIRHVKSATRLAPLKTVSVCKLELNAALMGSRLANFVQTTLRKRCDTRFFWTDSSTVRNWVRAVSARTRCM